MLAKNIINTYLTEILNMDEKQIQSLLSDAKVQEKKLEVFLIDKGIVNEKELYTYISEKMKTPIVDLKEKEITRDVLNIVPQPLAETHNIVCFGKSKDTIELAMLDPMDIQTIEFMHRKTGLTPEVSLTTPQNIKYALRLYHADLKEELKKAGFSPQKKHYKPTELQKIAEELPIINIVKSILEHAIFQDASDIHIEPTENDLSVRYRVDGVLKSVMHLPKHVQNGITARIKILANLKIDEHMAPQDGRFKIDVQEEKLAFRVSIMPVYDGEKIVMRVLHEGQKPLSLDQLGLLPSAKALLEAAIQKPHGLVLVTGPTGSGKTTTLYSVLGILNQPDVNICTIEDPIEYHVGGINQSQINPRAGFTFAGGLRAFLRQDPDIIMVGEIRDQETAEIAMHAAMTGHLVFSTLHTNDAPTTLPRLMDMNIPPFLVAFTTNIIVAQRLVRKLCEHCREPFTLDEPAVKELTKLIDAEAMAKLFELHDIKLQTAEKKLSSMEFYKSKGCRRCGDSGYKGRIGIYEVLDIDDGLEELINNRATAQKIHEYAITKGMVTMLQDGIIKAKQGITTIEEILRVTRE
jgi:type IV pilus assembly protein PilB